MTHIIEDRQYQTTLGSDLAQDGMYVELNDITDGRDDPLLFAFWSDADGRFTFSAYKPDLPFALIELFVEEARRRLPPRDDIPSVMGSGTEYCEKGTVPGVP